MKRCKGKSNIDIVKDYVAGVRPFTELSMHISEDQRYRNEGEKWTDSKGIQWQKLNGKNVRLTKTQGDVIREAIGDGLDCKKCGAKYKWANRIDRKMITRTSYCQDCLIDYETKLRVLGIYEAYEKYRLASYELGHLKMLKLKIKETLDYFQRTEGDVTTLPESEHDSAIVWKNTNKDKIVADAEADLKNVEELLAKGIPMTADFKQAYLDAIAKHDLEDIITR
jgi:hypothetical protein